MEETPSNTLYVKRISEKMRLGSMKKSIFAHFAQFGQILEIRINRDIKRRGQAWVTYENVENASKAKQSLQGNYIFGTPIKIEFAKSLNHLSLKMNGFFNPYGRKACRLSDEEARKLAFGHIPYHWDYDMNDDQDILTHKAMTSVETRTKSEPMVQNIAMQPPNKILFVQQIPESFTKDIIESFFSPFDGFVEVRISDLKGIAFVEYENEFYSANALSLLNGIDIGEGKSLFIQFSK